MSHHHDIEIHAQSLPVHHPHEQSDILHNIGTVNSLVRRNSNEIPNLHSNMFPENDRRKSHSNVHHPMSAEASLVDSVTNWHELTAEEAVRALGTAATGLSKSEAARRLHVYGPNKMSEQEKPSFFKRVWAQLNNVVVFILLVAWIVSAILQEWAEVGLIIGVIVINVMIGMIQEGKAEKAAQAIKSMLTSNAMVVRGGQRVAVDAESLVPGDVVFIQSGDRVPADIKLIEASSLQALEAMLTGESVPVSKHTEAIKGTASLGDRKNMMYSATLVVKGQGIGVVVATGDNAEIGKINELLVHVEQAKSNVLVQMDIVGRWLSIVVLIIAVVALALALTPPNNESAGEAFTTAVTIAVAIIPEGLPSILTITLAIAVSKMSRRNAIVRQLPCVETLGSVTTICSDKTGTLTKNEMTVTKICTDKGVYDVTGTGYDPSLGTIEITADRSGFLNSLRRILMGCILCNDSNLVNSSLGSAASWVPVGDPTEVALLTLAVKAKLDIQKTRDQHPRTLAIPFESDHKFMATLHPLNQDEEKSDEGFYTMFLKGAPDRLISCCSHQISNESSRDVIPIDQDYWLEAAAELSSLGLRVLALCEAKIPKAEVEHFKSGIPPEFVTDRKPFLAIKMLIAIIDPPREECIEAIKVAHTAGIVVKMITGDHAQTALAIGKMLGLVDVDHSKVIVGSEMDKMTDDELAEVVTKCNIFARSSPENKIRIVRALQANHQISSMTGDGVNDAPALRAADIGVAMGITGTDVSKEAAKIILADDNFATILVAVEVGRQVWDNLRKILLFNQPVNFAQGLCILFAIALGLPKPLSTVQVLYVNLVTSVTMGIMLSAEPAEDGIMTIPPRKVGKILIGKKIVWRCTFVTTLLVVFVLVSFGWAEKLGYSNKACLGVAFNTLVFSEMAYALNCRFLKHSSFHPRVLLGNYWCYISLGVAGGLQFLITYTPKLNTFFRVEALDGRAWGIIACFAGATFIIVEIEKALIDPIMVPIVRPLIGFIQRHSPRWLSINRH